ncbi:MAG: tRNA (N(6)-L-threonylcarbamoyladenosine(37)-C(2))-methylthiotransferase MtaB [Chitinophagaceae bacterium]
MSFDLPLFALKKNKSIAFHTLGCKLNYAETSTMQRMLQEAGYEKKSIQDENDVIVINTCSVTENADKECHQLVRRFKSKNPEAKIIVTGCYAQLKPEKIAAIDGVNMVLGAGEKFNIVKHLEEDLEQKIYSCEIADVNQFTASYSLHDRTRTFLKVQDGCDYSCSFCTIPMARGGSRSDSIQGVLANIEELHRAGVKEIVLTGINLGDFGKGHNGNKKNDENFLSLIQAIDKQGLISRFRISSIEPNLLTDEIIQFVSASKCFMPHFHIPLQSGTNKQLAAMRRRYKKELYEERVLKIKSLMPHCCIGVDVIVGFPDETDADFEATYRFLQELPISYLHVFTYSERENTLAATMPNTIPMSIRKERNNKLRILSEKKMNAFIQEHKGQERAVLFEHENSEHQLEGYTDNYIRIQTHFDKKRENTIVNWII